MGKRIGRSFGMAVLVFLVSYLIFNIAYCEWAVWRYPHNNSMAGVAAMIEGFPVGIACAVVGFVITFYRKGRSISN